MKKLIIIFLLYISCSSSKKELHQNKDANCIENTMFKSEFFGSINIVDSLITKNQNENFHKALQFISKYAAVSFEATLNYAKTYPYGIYEKDRVGWLKWYELNKCNNIKIKK